MAREMKLEPYSVILLQSMLEQLLKPYYLHFGKNYLQGTSSKTCVKKNIGIFGL